MVAARAIGRKKLVAARCTTVRVSSLAGCRPAWRSAAA
jgi:hypothetical protein